MLAAACAFALAAPAASSADPLELLPLPDLGGGGGDTAKQKERKRELRKARLDLKLEGTKAIVDDEYRHLPEIGKQGQLGVNRDKGRPFFLSHQQHGDLFVRAGILRGRADLVKRGLEAFDYGFDHRRSGTQPEEHAFFVQSVAHSLVLLDATRYGKERKGRLRKLRPRVRRMARQIISPGAFSEFKQRNGSYTHSAYVVGSALGLAELATGEGKFARYSAKAIRLGLKRQRDSGVNPELGGYDVRYQMAGTTYAERWAVYFPRRTLAERVKKMVNPGLDWMSKRIDGDGWIDWHGSTRTCQESNTNGEPKTPGYHYAIRGFAYWGALTDRRQRSSEARRARSYLERRKSDGSLCGSKGKLRPRDKKDGGGRGGGGSDPNPLPLPIDLFE